MVIRVCLPAGNNIYLLVHSDIVNVLLNTNDGGDRRYLFYFAIYIVWNASYVLAKTLEHEERISPSSFCGHLADY